MTRVGIAIAFSSCLVLGACGAGSPTRPSTVNVSAVTVTVPPSASTDSNTSPPTQPVPTPLPSAVLGATAFVAFGDSMTEGQSAVNRSMALVNVPSYPAYLQQLLAASYPSQAITVSNEGRAGEWAQDGQFRLPLALDRSQPPAEVLLLLEGANDLNALGASGVARAEAALQSMARAGRARKLRVFLATLPSQRPGGARAAAPGLVAELNRRIRVIARGEGAVLVDLELIFGTNYDLLSEDGLHPNSEGYRVIATSFAEAVRQELERPGLS